MKIKYVLILMLFLTPILSNNASIGSVTIDGKIYNQISMRPEFQFGKIGLGLDLYFYIDDEGNFYDKSWDFSDGKALETLLDKVYFLRYNQPSDKFYFRIGGMPSVTLGYGILVNNYSNTVEYPNVRRLGLDLRMNSGSGVSSQIIISDLKRTPGILALRTSFPVASRLKVGIFGITDLDMSKGLTDSDDDGYPDYFDDFPNDDSAHNEAEVIADSNGWEDGLCANLIAEGTYTSYEDCYSDLLSDNHNSFSEDSVDKENVSAIGMDFSLKLTKKISIYSQFAQMIGDELSISNSNNDGLEYRGSLGSGAIPIGLEVTFGPEKFKLSSNLEYRMNNRHFMYSFWDQAYELNRAQISSDSQIITKREQLKNYGELNGFYFGMNLSVFAENY